jgi:uncharacterized protein (DUF58 family)
MAAYIELQSLVNQQYKARGFSLLPSRPIQSLLSGRHSSRIRGRGLDFEELRGYLPGDDIRTMDWLVTARMQKPFVRVFTEERDRTTVTVLDQRINMFFGSRVSTKSVAAAEIAALAAWRAFHQGDRIGTLVFNDSHITEIKPHRSQATVMRILEESVNLNRELRADCPVSSNRKMLNEVLECVSRLARHDYTILLISDFHGVDAKTDELLLSLRQRNDLMAALIYDPLEMKLPSTGELVASNGQLQAELQFGRERIRKSLQDASDGRIRHILAWGAKLDMPVLPISTAEDTAAQVQCALGRAATQKRHR